MLVLYLNLCFCKTLGSLENLKIKHFCKSITLKIFNILGKEVATIVSNKLNQGNHTYKFVGKNLASGVYYYQLVAGEFREVKKMILLR